MGGIVGFRNGKSWATTGFVYEQFLRDVVARNARDEELVAHIESSIANQGLSFKLVENPKLEKRILRALKETAADIVSNKTGRSVPGVTWQLSNSDYEMYLGSVEELSLLLKEGGS